MGYALEWLPVPIFLWHARCLNGSWSFWETESVEKGFTILLADRNRYVREFLQRELTVEGYRVETAGDGREVLNLVGGLRPPDLLILDLEMPFLDGMEILQWFRDHRINVPVVLHGFLTDGTNHVAIDGIAGFVEKSGDHVNGLKETVLDVLRKHYPHRIESVPDASHAGPEESTKNSF